GSRFWQSGTFEVSKSSEPRAGSSLQVTLPSELEGISYIQVTIQKGTHKHVQGCEQSDGVALLIIGAQEQLLENVASIKAFQNFYNALIHRLKSRSGVSRKKNQLNGSQLDFHLVRRAVVDEEENLPLAELKFSVEYETIASGQLSINLPQNAFSQPRDPLAAASGGCAECALLQGALAQLAREQSQLQPSIPNLVVGNQITTALFPGVQLCIGLCHRTLQDRQPALPPSRLDHKHVLEHSLHQLLREYHYAFLHQGAPRPASGPVGVPRKRHLAGPHAHDRQASVTPFTEQKPGQKPSEAILEKIIAQTQHVALRLR
ncbi:mediator of RNA polymerase II transcription subunit 17-like, partial [Dermacentor silvarum]|uniref:mediator of RNA polymerase II transcription subunit 17-like n=1 Tax=Dermacentor silvarum TaxID=543639 RepID=UPI002101416C